MSSPTSEDTPDPTHGEAFQVATWKTLIDVAMNVGDPARPAPRTFDYDEVVDDTPDGPDDLPDRYVEITVTENAASPVRMNGARPLTGWWLTTRLVARRSDEIRWMRGRLRVCVQDRRVDELESTPVRVDDDGVLNPDDGGYCSQLVVWKYAAPNQ